MGDWREFVEGRWVYSGFSQGSRRCRPNVVRRRGGSLGAYFDNYWIGIRVDHDNCA